jgi:type I restriction enzyme R subunit
VQTCKNIVIARVVNSMTEFKQIIGRGTRVRDDYGKYYFSILDYTGSATRHFADPDFDGDPALITEEEIDETGQVTGEEIVSPEEPEEGGEIVEPEPPIIEEAPPYEPASFTWTTGISRLPPTSSMNLTPTVKNCG